MLELSSDLFTDAFGLPRPRWEIVYQQLQKEWPLAQKDAFWCAAQRAWLERLRDAMSEPYSILESENHVILTAYQGEADWMLEFAEELNRLVAAMLDGALSRESFGKFAILVLAGEARYWQYIRHYSKDNRPRESGGCCIFDGDAHIALPGVRNFKHVLVHEIVHARLAHLRKLPHWVHEGIAQHIDRRLVTRSRMLADRFRANQHRVWWMNHGIQLFWTGAIFDERRADWRRVGYELAEQLADAMIAAGRATFNAFLVDADKAGAGEAACRKHYGVGLGVSMQQILGEGDWEPKF